MLVLFTWIVPPDFHDVLMKYTRHGYRVIALAYKPLSEKLKYPKLQRIERYAFTT
jgi:magnesium-transporting ATPase (P-type)